MEKWIIIVDGTQLYSGDRKINDKCLEQHYNKGTDQETVGIKKITVQSRADSIKNP